MNKKILSLLTLSFLVNFSLQAQESYKAPRLKMKNAPGYKSVVVDSSSSEWESSYKVEETAGAERSVASDKEEVEAKKKTLRNPSSVERKYSEPAAWIYDRK